MTEQDQILALREELHQHNYNYYVLNTPTISDKEFDELLIERSPKGTFWLHFAVRPKDNRRKVRFIQT